MAAHEPIGGTGKDILQCRDDRLLHTAHIGHHTIRGHHALQRHHLRSQRRHRLHRRTQHHQPYSIKHIIELGGSQIGKAALRELHSRFWTSGPSTQMGARETGTQRHQHGATEQTGAHDSDVRWQRGIQRDKEKAFKKVGAWSSDLPGQA